MLITFTRTNGKYNPEKKRRLSIKFVWRNQRVENRDLGMKIKIISAIISALLRQSVTKA
jgi:hypothetical protein